MNKRTPGVVQRSTAPGIFLFTDKPLRARTIEEAELHIQSLTARVIELEIKLSDHAQRFDTLQTPWWKRVMFKIDGWPWYDLNGKQKNRPWHRGDK